MNKEILLAAGWVCRGHFFEKGGFFVWAANYRDTNETRWYICPCDRANGSRVKSLDQVNEYIRKSKTEI